MGTPDFAVPTLRAVLDHDGHVTAVVTQPDKPRGRGKRVTPSAVKRLALERTIPVFQPEDVSSDSFCDQIREMNPDLIIVVAFGRILKKRLLDIPGWGAINIHASLLPKLRGAAPIQRAIMNDERVTGLTVMRMDEGMDTGPIFFQEEVPVMKDETAGHLQDRLAVFAGDLMVRFLRSTAQGPVPERPQNSAEATYALKIERKAGLVKWFEPAERVSALIRALDPRPGAYTIWEGREIKLFSSTVMDKIPGRSIPGRVRGLAEGCLVVETGRGSVGIREVQAPGKKRLPAALYLRGVVIPEGSILGSA
ncbi:MAG: methionyl-tRNA formyltransferase [Deltaproteobacteria bacterium]|nr:methionyl-tRNA formyltransferase [Deltaproteobacteria bacterium]